MQSSEQIGVVKTLVSLPHNNQSRIYLITHVKTRGQHEWLNGSQFDWLDWYMALCLAGFLNIQQRGGKSSHIRGKTSL